MSSTKVEESIYESSSGYAVRANWQKKSIAENFAFSRYDSKEDTLVAARRYRDACRELAAQKKEERKAVIEEFDNGWDFPKPSLPEFKRRKSITPPKGIAHND